MPADFSAIATLWFEGWWNQRRDDVLELLTTPDCVAQCEGVEGGMDRAAMIEHRRAWLNAVPDMRVDVLNVLAGDAVAIVEWRVHGTHRGAGLGIAPSGLPVDFGGYTTVYFEGDRIARGVDRWNRGELMVSLMQVRLSDLQQAGLTERESEVALLMADRRTYVEIAEDLSIAPNTARRHCEKVMAKLGVRRRQDVAAALGKIPTAPIPPHGSDF